MTTGPEGNIPEVSVHVASKNTRLYTELCLRSMWRQAGVPFHLIVGDCMSNDGSLRMLRRMANSGKLTFQIGTENTQHYNWIDYWRSECQSAFFVVVDSDVEFLKPNWLPRLLAAMDNQSMLAFQFVPEYQSKGEPQFGPDYTYTVLKRPDPCVLALDQMRTSGISTSFAPREAEDRWPPVRFNDVGGAFGEALEDAGQSWGAMPNELRRSFRHFYARSWKKRSLRQRVREMPTLMRLTARVLYLRMLDRLSPVSTSRAAEHVYGPGPVDSWRHLTPGGWTDGDT